MSEIRNENQPSWADIEVALATEIGPFDHACTDSSTRFGCLVLGTDGTEDLEALRLGVQ